MKRTQLEALIAKSVSNLAHLLDEYTTEIESAISEVEQSAMDEDGPTKLTISHSIIIDVAKGAMTDRIAWSIKKSAETANIIPDPDQMKLDGLD